jgi:hypothetical protein
MSEPGLQSVRGHPLRNVIFQRDPDFESAPERPHQVFEKGRQQRAGSPLYRTGRGSPQASLFPTRPPFLIFYDLPLVFMCICRWRNVLACLIPIKTRVGATLYHSMLPYYLRTRDPALKIIRADSGCRTGDLRARRKPVQKLLRTPHR